MRKENKEPVRSGLKKLLGFVYTEFGQTASYKQKKGADLQSWQIISDNLRMPYQSNMTAKEQNQEQVQCKKQMEHLLNHHGYFLIRRIGQGRTGAVWLVFHQATGALRVAKAIFASSSATGMGKYGAFRTCENL